MTPLEAGARAWFDRVQSGRFDAGRLDDSGRKWTWDSLPESDRIAYLALARPVVEAALTAVNANGSTA